jgi:hypothetical protein
LLQGSLASDGTVTLADITVLQHPEWGLLTGTIARSLTSPFWQLNLKELNPPGFFPPSECYNGLLHFKESGTWHGDFQWAAWTTWTAENGPFPCLWGGVTCDEGGTVTTLNPNGITGVNAGVMGDVRHLVACASSMTTLKLGETFVSGDVADLAPLMRLTYLDVSGPGVHNPSPVGGDVGGLAPLTQLTFLDLGSTGVGVNGPGLAALTNLTHLDASYNPSVNGDLADLVPLTQLSELYLDHTSVSGSTEGIGVPRRSMPNMPTNCCPWC